MTDADSIRRLTAGPVRFTEQGTLVLDLRSGATLEVSIRAGDADDTTLFARWGAPVEAKEMTFEDVAVVAEQSRSVLLRCTPSADGIEIAMSVYLDGLSRQGFVDAVGEIARAHEIIDAAVRALLQHREMIEAAQRSLEETRTAAEEAETRRSSQQGATGEWYATYTVPDSGLTAWAAPDPALEPVATLAPGTELQLRQRSGDWAEVVASSGWVGWVDARRLSPR